MEEDGEETPRSPFWIQSTTNLRRGELYRRRASSLFFNSGVLILLLLLFAVISMVYIIPSIISFSSQIFRPNLVKKSWDSINLVLVLFALAFGFLGRNINNDEKSRFDRSSSELSTGPPVSTPPAALIQHQWYDFPEQPIGGLRRHRSTSSYPDLRELSPPWNHHPWRFSDDTHLNSHRVLDSDPDTKDVIHVVDLDSYAPPSEESYTPPPPPPPPAPKDESDPPPSQLPAPKDESDPPPSQLPSSPSQLPSPPSLPPAIGRKKPSRTYDNAAEKSTLNQALVTARSLPSFQDSEQKGETLIRIRKRDKGERRRARSSEPSRKIVSMEDSDQRKRTGGGNATKEFFTSFYQKKKKKRQRQKSMDNLDTLLHHPQPPLKFQLPPPSPPPPPPPPPSVLNNLFTSKKDRLKKTSSTTLPPKSTITRVPPFVTEKPRVPLNMSFIDDSSSGGESPMGRIPPPPPMPPFKMPDWKFAVEGNYVRVQSTLSSGSDGDGDEGQSPSSSAVASPLFCPSPDVDTKADSFIARFRAGLKLEKINSFNQNQGLRMSNLGPK